MKSESYVKAVLRGIQRHRKEAMKCGLIDVASQLDIKISTLEWVLQKNEVERNE